MCQPIMSSMQGYHPDLAKWGRSIASFPGVAKKKPRGESTKMSNTRQRERSVSTGVAAEGAQYPDRMVELQSRMLTDTGVWLASQGYLALCSREDEEEYIRLVCGRYQHVTVKLHAWGQCVHCGEMSSKSMQKIGQTYPYLALRPEPGRKMRFTATSSRESLFVQPGKGGPDELPGFYSFQ